MKFFTTIVTGFTAILSLSGYTVAQSGSCAVENGGPGIDTLNALKSLMFAKMFPSGQHCFPPVDSVSGRPVGWWCGHCNGFFMLISNGGGYEQCVTTGDVNTALNGANADGQDCGYSIGADQWMGVQYGPDSHDPQNTGGGWETCTDTC